MYIHSLRHTCIDRFLDLYVDLYLMQFLLTRRSRARHANTKII